MSALSDYDFIKMVQEGSLDVVEWLGNQDEDSIRERVYKRVPEDIDISVGSYEYDAIEPANTEFAVVYFMLRNVILLAFPQYAFGEWLTLSAAAHGVYRRDATYASGKLLVTGAAGTVIPAGTKFSNTTSADSNFPVKYYTSKKEMVVGNDGWVEVEIIADEAGAIGNVKEGEVNLNLSGIKKLDSISNELAFTNGADKESDEALLERLLDKVRNPTSGGNRNDYRQWAREVPGVVEAEVVPLWNGPGTVQVIIIGEDGSSIPDLIDAVKEHLDPRDHEGEGEGRAPIGAVVTVMTTENYDIRIDISGLEFEHGYDLPNSRRNIINAIKKEVSKVPIGGLVRIHYVEDVIRHVTGVKDFGYIFMNYAESNIQVPVHQKAAVKEVFFDGN